MKEECMYFLVLAHTATSTSLERTATLAGKSETCNQQISRTFSRLFH